MKNYLLSLNNKWEEFKIFLFSSVILNYLVNIYKKNIINFAIIQIGVILLLGAYYIEGDIFVKKLVNVCSITIFLFFIKILYKILYYWITDSFEIGLELNNKIIKNYFLKHNKINVVCKFMFTYINLWRLLLIFRNKLARFMRYYRYFMYKFKLLKNWIIIETIVDFIITNLILRYITKIIDEVYLKLKNSIIENKWKEILYGRIQIFLIICVFKGLTSFILIIFVIKFISLLKEIVIEWASGNKINIYKTDMNYKLTINSYIFKNLNFGSERYIGYNKIIVQLKDSDFLDSLYNNSKKLQFLDIKYGIETNVLAELNNVLKNILHIFLLINYKKNNKINNIDEKLKEIIDLTKLIVSYLPKNQLKIDLIWLNHKPSLRFCIEKPFIDYKWTEGLIDLYMIQLKDKVNNFYEKFNDDMLILEFLDLDEELFLLYEKNSNKYKKIIFKKFLSKFLLNLIK